MNKFTYIIVLFLGLLCFTSCTEDDGTESTEYADWQSRNDIYFELCYQQCLDSVAKDPTTYKMIKALSKDQSTVGAHTDYILVKVLKNGTGEKSPQATDTVRVHYCGKLMPSDSYEDGYQFDSSWYGNYDVTTMTPYEDCVSNFVDGFNTALQYMHVGDRWSVIIPYKLGYNSTAKTGIPAYSTLRFDITLQSFARVGYQMPDFQ